MTRKDSYEKTLGAFRSGKIDILIGTQMIAKGLHFPNVTLVGVIYADLSLRIPDFRAQERTFQLLTQVAGRAGRGEVEGLVIIQTYSPFNPAIQYAVDHDYKGFYEEEMELREILAYPPAGHMIAVNIKGKSEEGVAEFAVEYLARVQSSVHADITVSGPNPSPIAKIKGNHRYAILFRGSGMKELRAKLRQETLRGKRPNNIWVSVDADPLNLM
jgi:primosomal protein N' (replication factor Y)